MKFINNNYSPLVILFGVVVLLLLLSYGQVELDYGLFKIKKIDILSQIRQDKKIVHPQRALSQTAIASTAPAAVTSQVQAAVSKDIQEEVFPEGFVPVEDFGAEKNSNMIKFFSSLENESQDKQIRIAHFGDSLIEGDMITKDFRFFLQRQFGGRGVGFVPITSNVARFRSTIQHSFSDNWRTQAVVNGSVSKSMAGLAGRVFFPRKTCHRPDSVTNHISSNSWVEYRALNNKDNKTNSFGLIRLLYGSVKGEAYVTYALDDGELQTRQLSYGEGLRELIINEDKITRKIQLCFSSPDDMEVYGMSFEDGPGIYVDNYSLRRASGTYLNKIENSVYQGFNKLLDYRLIIIQYGANIADPNIDNFRWYENQLYEILLKLKSQFPEAGILVVSAADKSMKSDLEYKTNPAIPKIVSAQRNAAKKAEVAFWNLYQAMGGENAMLKWRRQNLVSDDYTHFSHAGAKKIADLLSKALSYGLSHYESSRKIRP